MNKIIEKEIDCTLMDARNISNLIESFTSLTNLQKAWKRFCEEKSMVDTCDYNDYSILSSIKDPKSLFQFDYFNSRKDFISLYCNKECQEQIIQYLLQHFDYTFFNASLIYSLYKDEDYCCLGDTDLPLAEQEFDNYNGDNNEDDFDLAMSNASIIKLIILMCNYKLPLAKQYFDTYFKQQIPTEVYERIWIRAIDHESELYPFDQEDEEDDFDEEDENDEDEFRYNLTIE